MDMVSSGTLPAGLTIPSSSRSLVALSLRASLCSRFANRTVAIAPSLISLQALHAAGSIKTVGSVGLTHETHKITEEEASVIGDEDSEEDWEGELLSELNPLIYLHGRNHRKGKRQKDALDGEIPSPHAGENALEWAERARQRALQALEARNPTAAIYLKKKIEPTSDDKKKRRKKKKKVQKSILAKQKSGPQNGQTSISAKGFEEALRLEDKNSTSATETDDSPVVREDVGLDDPLTTVLDDFDLNGIENIADLPMVTNIEFSRWNTSRPPDALGMPSDHVTNLEPGLEREKSFNKRLVAAKTALEVLEIVGSGEEMTRSLGFPSLLTPLNAATALHRIAKHMETSAAHKSDRLAFARKRHMAELVARSMQVLAGCSAQGLSNIAWALSKVGGNVLYSAEMDLIASAALRKVSDLNSQNIANTLGAYASMQHATPTLFVRLCDRAVDILGDFSSQELAQVLWAHAELNQPADPLLDALDNICLLSEKGLFNPFIQSASSCSKFDHFLSPTLSTVTSNPFANASADHLANLGWSYAVLNQIKRPSFKCLWQMLETILNQNVDSVGDITGCLNTWHLSQIHQVNLCLMYEYPDHGPILLKDAAAQAWEIQKAKSWFPSQYQKDVKWHLVSSGQDWMAEYTAADYSLDLALPKEKMAIEIDGPSHFIRNTGSPLGHTILKRRLLFQAGWRVFPISYRVWEELDGEAEQTSFLKELLMAGI